MDPSDGRFARRCFISSCIMYLIRHGLTENNAAEMPVMQGSESNPPLSADGQLQARKLRLHLRGRRINAVYTSPLLRASQTAQILVQNQEASISMRQQLIEAAAGRWDGLTYGEIQEQYPSAYNLWLRDPGTYGYPGGENLSEVQSRVLPFLEQVGLEHSGQRVAIVTHKQVLRSVCARLTDLPLSRARELQYANCGVTILRYHKGRLSIEVMHCKFSRDIGGAEHGS
jgi:broad specificity phosphatase PhoE